MSNQSQHFFVFIKIKMFQWPRTYHSFLFALCFVKKCFSNYTKEEIFGLSNQCKQKEFKSRPPSKINRIINLSFLKPNTQVFTKTKHLIYTNLTTKSLPNVLGYFHHFLSIIVFFLKTQINWITFCVNNKIFSYFLSQLIIFKVN